jgi:hypothetical protein
MWTVSLIAALSCLYIAGEEASWGQHFFHWNTPEYWAVINNQGETNLHNAYLITEGLPRSILGICVAIGGLGVPFAALFYPVLSACRISVFLPPLALVPTSLGAVGFKLVDYLQNSGYLTGVDRTRVHFDQSIHVPEDEICFFVFDAPSSLEAVLLAERAGLDHFRVVEAIPSREEYRS